MSIQRYEDQQANGHVETYQPPATGRVAVPANKTLAALAEWAQAATAAHQVATNLVQTSFVPEAFRNKPHEATAAILAGDEVGLSPMAALRAFDVIQGTAAPRAITQRAIAQSRGHEIWKVESSSTRAIVRGRRAGSTIVQESIWTIDRARALNLTGKPNWKNQPEAMLIARATSEVCRLVASDALLGLPYSVEEILDGVDPEQGTPAFDAGPAPASPEQAEPKRRTAKRATPVKKAAARPVPPPEPAPPAAEEPPLPGEDGYDDEDPDAGRDLVTKPQLGKIHALFTECQWTDRHDRLRAASAIVGRQVGSSTELTKDEASTLIDTLELAAGNDDPAGRLAELVAGVSGDEAVDAELVDGEE